MKKIIFAVVLLLKLNLSSKAQNNALYFNDSNSNSITLPYASVLDFSLTSKFSIEGWFNTTSTGIATIYSSLVNIQPFTGCDVAITYTRLRFAFTNTDSYNWILTETVNAYNDGNWHHFACVYKGVPNAANVDLYVDGVLQAQNVIGNSLSASTNNGNASHIGSRNNAAYFMNGAIDELRIWGKALCASEVVARKNCQLTGTETNLLAYYNFNQGVAGGNNGGLTALPDISGHGITGTLTGFSLSGNSSNWGPSTSTLTGACTLNSPVSISGNTVVCVGGSNIFTASGASSYTWSGIANTATIVVSPTVNTTYTVTGNNINTGCYGSASVALIVSACTGIQNLYVNDKILNVSPNPGTGIYILSGLETGTLIELYSFDGKLVFKDIADSENTLLNIEFLDKGIYILNCLSKTNKKITQKIIKE